MEFKKSTQVAIGGVASAMCLVMMFLTGFIPFSSYSLPAMAGIVLIIVAEENGTRTALLVFAVTSLLALMVVPDREAVLLFLMLLGYYPMLKFQLERLAKPLSYLLKFVLVNVSVIAFYYVVRFVLMMPDMIAEWGEFGQYAVLVALGMVNFTFFLYDYLLSLARLAYVKKFRGLLMRKLH